jgi:hypothetical protein
MGEITSRAWSQVAIWRMELGDHAAAQQAAQKAVEAAPPAAAGLALLIRFATQPPASSSEWAIRAERAFPDAAMSQLKTSARAYALLFSKDFAGALPLLRETYASWNPARPDPGVPVLLAWAYVETGRPQDAAPLLRFNPISESSGLNPFTSFWFPRLFYLRGVVQPAERKPQFQLFLKLSGPNPLMWGEEEKAQAGK